MTATNTARYITPQEAADDIAVTVQFIWKLIRLNRFPVHHVRIGSVIRIQRSAWDAFLLSGDSLPSSAPVNPKKRGRPSKAVPPIDMDRQRELSA